MITAVPAGCPLSTKLKHHRFKLFTALLSRVKRSRVTCRPVERWPVRDWLRSLAADAVVLDADFKETLTRERDVQALMPLGSRPWRMAFSAKGCTSSGGTSHSSASTSWVDSR